MVHRVAGGCLDGADARGRAAARVGSLPRVVPRPIAGGGARARPVRPPDRRGRNGVRRAPARRHRALGLGDPPRPHVLQRRGGRASRGNRMVGARPSADRGGDDARRAAAPARTHDHAAAARPVARGRRGDRVPLLLHLVRRDHRARRATVRDARDRDLHAGSATLRSPDRRRARAAAARSGRRRLDRRRRARAARRLSLVLERRAAAACPERDRPWVVSIVAVSVALLALAPAALVWRSLSVGGTVGLRSFRRARRRDPRAPRRAVARDRQLARLCERGDGDRARARHPGGDCDCARRARARCAGDVAARRLGGNARVRLPARLR